jgi:hypothetical protein
MSSPRQRGFPTWLDGAGQGGGSSSSLGAGSIDHPAPLVTLGTIRFSAAERRVTAVSGDVDLQIAT